MTNDVVIKRCPFCGHEARLAKDDEGRWQQVVCGGCGGKGPERMQAGAIEAWNRRSSSPDAQSPEPPAHSTLVLRVCTAYEQGYGQHGRAIENPYTAGTRESEAWNMGWQVAKQNACDGPQPCVSHLALGEAERLLRSAHTELSLSPNDQALAARIGEWLGPSPNRTG